MTTKTKLFYCTFGWSQKPINQKHYRVVRAKDESRARKFMHIVYNNNWVSIYKSAKEAAIEEWNLIAVTGFKTPREIKENKVTWEIL